MATPTMQHSPALTKALNALIHLDCDAICAYDAAIEKLEDAESKRALTGFRADHARHVTDLQRCVRNLGGEPASGPDLMRVMTEGMVRLRAIQGDHGILAAMKLNEDKTNLAYEGAVKLKEATAEVRQLLAKNLEDERRHRAWIIARLDRMKK